MKKLLAVALLSAMVLPVFAGKKDKESFKVMHVNDLADALKSQNPPALFDANNKETRDKYGVIPGATLLKSYKKVNAKLLGASKEKPLVFYCANVQCMASHEAAEKAIKLGYKDVSVMVDGIMGWKEGGQTTAKP